MNKVHQWTNIDESHKHDSEQRKSDTKEHKTYYSIYTKLKSKQNEPGLLQVRTAVTPGVLVTRREPLGFGGTSHALFLGLGAGHAVCSLCENRLSCALWFVLPLVCMLLRCRAYITTKNPKEKKTEWIIEQWQLARSRIFLKDATLPYYCYFLNNKGYREMQFLKKEGLHLANITSLWLNFLTCQMGSISVVNTGLFFSSSLFLFLISLSSTQRYLSFLLNVSPLSSYLP